MINDSKFVTEDDFLMCRSEPNLEEIDCYNKYNTETNDEFLKRIRGSNEIQRSNPK